MYENFSAPSTESLDSIFNRLQKIVNQLAILGENISQEDLNLKFLRSLPSEWNTHIVVCRNKPDLDTMSFDDLYNNFKIVEQEVKGTANSISSSSTQNIAFVSSPISTNKVNTAYQITINESDTAGYDKSKVESFYWNKLGHSTRECRGPRNQDSRNWNQDSSRRTVNVEETSSKAMLVIDGAGFDWSYMVDDEVPTNMALMAFSDSEVHNDKTCSKTYLKSFKNLKTQLDDLRIEFNKSEFNLATYKRGLTSVEEQLVFYKKNEVIFCEQLVVLKIDISYKDSEISMLKSELEKLKQEKESNQLKNEKFDNASKSLDKLIGSQITDNSRKGVGFVSYNVVPPPPTGYGPKTSKSVSEDICNEVREFPDAPLVEELVSNDKLEKKIVSPTKIEFVRPKQEKSVRKPVKYAKMYRLTAITIKGKGWPKAVNTAKPNSAVVNAVRANQVNAIKASACWVWRPTKLNSASINLKRHNYVDARGRSKSGTCPISQNLRNLMEDMLPLGEEPKEEKLPATLDESMLWHRRLGHVNFKTINKLVKENLVTGLPVKHFENDQTCVACLKGKQHKASSTKDETSGILKSFITEIENLVDKKVKIIRCDNETKFKNRVMSEFSEKKGIKREFSVARNPQQNGVAKRRNRTLIEAVRTMLADSKLPTTFWAEAVNTACYVQNRALVVKPHNKTPYELFRGKFDGKSDEGFFVGYSLNSKAFRVYNIRTRKVEENLHIRFLEDKPIIAGDGPKWLFDIDVLTKSMNYVPVVAGGIDDQERLENSAQDVNTDGPSINTASINFNIELDMSNITTTYPVPSTPNTKIHKDHSLDHVIGDVQFGVYRNKKDKRGIMIRNMARLVAQGYTQEEGIDYDEVFPLVARIEAIRLFLAYSSFKDFVVYQMDVKSAFLYGKIEEEVYVCQPPGFEDSEFPDKVYKAKKALYGLHQVPKAWYETLSTYLLDNGFQRGQIDKTLFIKRIKGLQMTQKDDGIFICQDKYVEEILKKFSFSTMKTSNTPMETSKPLLKDAKAEDVDVYLYRSMIGSLMYLTASRPDIIDYVGVSLDRKSTTGGSQFLRSGLISWQCKKQTIVETSTTKAEYVAAVSCCGQGRLIMSRCSGLCLKWNGTAADGEISKIEVKSGNSKVSTARALLSTAGHYLVLLDIT
ncbi:putative ribonuclease H-like domain-containing protein [Tanacetum coccineum]